MSASLLTSCNSSCADPSVPDRAGAGVHLQLAGHSGNPFHVSEGLVHGQLFVQVLATVAVGLHESNSNEVIVFMLTSGYGSGRHNGYGSPIHVLNGLDAADSDEEKPVNPHPWDSAGKILKPYR